MKLQTKATQVAQRVSHLIQAGKKGGRRATPGGSIAEPAWFKVVLANPPTYNLIPKLRALDKFREQAKQLPIGEKNPGTGLFVTRHSRKPIGKRQIYKPPTITYSEDKIRSLFYEQHPWELARPKVVLENDGNDHARYDWSTIDQPRKRLDGESVVQRTLYLLKTPQYSDAKGWTPAYDQARMEFYRLRMREEAEIEVAAEEAVMFGSVFSDSYLEYGAAAEQTVVEKWAADAAEATMAKRANMSGPVVAEEESAPVEKESEV